MDRYLHDAVAALPSAGRRHALPLAAGCETWRTCAQRSAHTHNTHTHNARAGNITGIVTAPLMVKAVLGSLTDAKVDSLDLLVKLGVSILVPVLVGKALRELVKPIR